MCLIFGVYMGLNRCEKMGFDLISSMDLESYFYSLGSDYIEIVQQNDLKRLSRALKKGTIIVITGESVDHRIPQNFNNFLDCPNVSLCVAENWLGGDHPKLSTLDTKTEYLSKLLYRSLRSRCRIVNFFTGGLCLEWRNFLASARHLGVADLITVFALDEDAVECVELEGIEVRTDLVRADEFHSEVDFQKSGFGKITAQKVKAIEIMLREGFFVFYMDTDIVLIQNPIEDYFKLPPRLVYMQSDRADFKVTPEYFCSGVIYAAPSSKTADVMKAAYPLILEKSDESSMHDQEVLNELLTDVGTLSPEGYPNGHRYFEERSKCLEVPILIHNNYIVGVSAKIDRFKKNGLWFVGH